MKAVLVTGSSGDIGSSICQTLAADGWSLYLHYHSNQQRITDMMQEFQERYPNQEFISIKADLVKEKDRKSVV